MLFLMLILVLSHLIALLVGYGLAWDAFRYAIDNFIETRERVYKVKMNE